MDTIKFAITKKSIHDRIFATSAYTTRARETMGMPGSIAERMLITADDKHLIDPMIDNSVNEVSCMIARYHPGSSVEFNMEENDGEYRFCIAAPVNYPAGNAGKLAQSIESYIAGRTLQEWYSDIRPDEATNAAARVQNEAMTIQEMLAQRTRPTIITDNA